MLALFLLFVRGCLEASGKQATHSATSAWSPSFNFLTGLPSKRTV